MIYICYCICEHDPVNYMLLSIFVVEETKSQEKYIDLTKVTNSK